MNANEKNIPLPPYGKTRPRALTICHCFIPNKYPFKEMEIGDSFFVDTDGSKKEIARALNRLAPACQRLKPLKFTVRTEGTGVRCWRIA